MSGRADGAEHDAGNGHLEVRRFVQDNRVVAAQFKQAAAQAGGYFGGYTPAHAGGTGEGHQLYALVIDKAVRQVMSTGRKAQENGRKTAFFKRLVTDLLHGDSAQGAFR